MDYVSNYGFSVLRKLVLLDIDSIHYVQENILLHHFRIGFLIIGVKMLMKREANVL